MSTQTEQTAWPEGVIARYLTIGGATVDITSSDTDVSAAVSCTGCGKADRSSLVRADCWGGPEHAREANTNDAHRWAQTHAETCRAMPRPQA